MSDYEIDLLITNSKQSISQLEEITSKLEGVCKKDIVQSLVSVKEQFQDLLDYVEDKI